MTIDDLRERARQMCELGHLVSDERARLEAQLLAAHYSQMADALAATVCPRSSTSAMNGSISRFSNDCIAGTSPHRDKKATR